jgi:hypothetical protein
MLFGLEKRGIKPFFAIVRVILRKIKGHACPLALCADFCYNSRRKAISGGKLC